MSDGWTYDANGNRLTQSGTSSSTFNVSSTNNHISSITGALNRGTYSYDAAGNITGYGNSGTVSTTYNQRGRMTANANRGPLVFGGAPGKPADPTRADPKSDN